MSNNQPPSASSDASHSNLWSAFAQSVRDNVVAEVAVQVLRFGGMIVLARALRPDDFGIFRVLLVISAFAMLVNESGIPDALIQRKIVTDDHLNTAWWLSIALAGFSATVLYAIAPFIAHAMGMAELTSGVRLLCIPILLEGTAVTANSRLRRALRFSALAAADVVGEAAFLIVALAMLWNGLPRWSLPAGLGARFAFHAAVVWFADPRLPNGVPRVRAARDLARFSSSVLGGRIIYVLSANMDFILVGRLLGSTALGFYSMAWDLLRFIPDRLYKVAGRVTLPAFCRLQDDNLQLARAYREFFGYLARIVIPLVACASIAAPELIGFVYGSKWVPVAIPMRLLAPGLILMGLRVGIGSIYYTKDHPAFDIYLHSARLAMIIVVVSAMSFWGLWSVSGGMSFVEGSISIAGQWMAGWLIGVGVFTLARDAQPGMILAALCSVATFAGKIAAAGLDVHGVLALVMMIVPPGIVFLWREGSDVAGMIGKAFGPGSSSPIDFTEGQA